MLDAGVVEVDGGAVRTPYTGFAVSRAPGRSLPAAPRDPVLLPA